MLHFCWNLTALVKKNMWTNHISYTLSPTLEIHLIYFIFCQSCHSWKKRWGYIQLWLGVCVVLSATHVPVELVVLYVFDTSAVRRSICVFHWGLRMFEIQLDLRGEPVFIGQSTIELTEQARSCWDGRMFFLSTSWSVCLYKQPAGVLKVKWRSTNVSFEGFTSFL